MTDQNTTTTDTASTSLARLSGMHAGAELAKRFDYAAKNCNLLTPSTAIGTLPPGTSIGLSVTKLDPDADAYPVGGGRYALLKHSLERLASSAGASFESVERLDDGSDSRFAHVRVVMTTRGLDGVPVRSVGEKCLDLRDGSDAAKRIIENARTRAIGETQLRDMRAYCYEHASTRARLRALRAGLGVRSSYTKEEFARPWVIARLSLTMEDQDPSTRRELALLFASHMLGLDRPRPARALPPSTRSTPRFAHRAAPPPVGSVPLDDEDVVDVDFVADQPRAATPPPHEDQVPNGPLDVVGNLVPDDAPLEERPASPSRVSGFSLPAKRGETRVPIENAEEKDLVYWRKRLAKNLDDGSSQRPEQDEPLLAAIEAELVARGGSDGR